MKKVCIYLSLITALLVLFVACKPHVSTDETFEDKEITCKIVDESGTELLSQSGTVTVGSLTGVQAPAAFSFKKTDLKKEGYIFSKLQDENGNEADISQETISITLGASATYTAVFTPITYTIKFQEFIYSTENEGFPESISCKYDEEATLPDNTITKDGKKCNGWDYSYQDAENQIKTDSYKNGDKIKNLTVKDGDVLIFTPSYSDYDFTLTFTNSDWTSVSIFIDEGETIAADKVPEIVPTTGYNDEGWYDSEDETITVVDFSNYKVSKNVTFKPKKTEKSCKITFETEYGEAPDAATMTGPYAYQYCGAITSTGYEFDGWYDAAGNKVESLSAQTEGWTYEDIKLTAKWTPWTGKVTLYYDKGEIDSVSELVQKNENNEYVSYTIDASYGETVTLPKDIYLKNGYKFLGWGTTANNGVTIENGGTYTYKEGVTYKGAEVRLYPYFEGPKITIDLDNTTFVDTLIAANGSAINTFYPLKKGYSDYFYNIKMSGKYVEDGKSTVEQTWRPNNTDNEELVLKNKPRYKAGTYEFTLTAEIKMTTTQDYKQTIQVTMEPGKQAELKFENLVYSTNSDDQERMRDIKSVTIPATATEAVWLEWVDNGYTTNTDAVNKGHWGRIELQKNADGTYTTKDPFFTFVADDTAVETKCYEMKFTPVDATYNPLGSTTYTVKAYTSLGKITVIEADFTK